MAGWLRRAEQREPSAGLADDGPDDSPEAMRGRVWQVVTLVNRNAGRLPVEAVVLARDVTDSLSAVVALGRDRPLDVYAVSSLDAIVGDYLPTTLHAYLALDPRVTDRVGPSGRTPRAAVREQLDALVAAADELLVAAREHDVDLLTSQGSFLQTKFGGSDLTL